MEHYKYPTVRVAPRFHTEENEAILEEILGMLFDEDNDKLKTSGLVTFPIAYILVINYYEEWDDEILESYWVNEFYEKYPSYTSAKLAYATCSLPSYKELNVETLFKEEIDLLFHGKNDRLKFYEEEYQSLLYFLCRHYVKEGNDEKAKEIYQFAFSIQNYELTRDLAFVLRKREEDNAFLSSDNDNALMWAVIFSDYLYEMSIPEEPNNDVSYILLNKISNFITEEEVSTILEFQDKAKLRLDLYWVLRGGLTRVSKHGDKAGFDFLYNVIYLAAHHRLYDVIKLVVERVVEMPPELLEEFVGDIGIETLSQPLSILAVEKPEIFTKLIKESDFQPYYTAIFFDILCYTYRINGGETVLKQIDASWNYAFKSDQELLGYFVGSIIDHEIKDYQEKLEAAYANNYIDLKFFEKLENLEPSLWMRKYDAPSIQETTFTTMLKTYSDSVAKVHKESVFNLEEHIDEMIEESLVAASAVMDSLESEEIFYDENEFFMDDNDDPLNLHSEYQEPIVRQDPKVGRNDPCPCGSGKKYKKCCLNMN